MDRLTVIIPLYNQEKYIEQCVRSIMKQHLNDMSILIIDDGSTDSSYEICERLAHEDECIKIIRQENKGPSCARKTGIENCSSEYVTFVDADDFILDNAYISAYQYIEAGIDMIFYEISRYVDDNNIKREHHILPGGYYDRKSIENIVYSKLIWNFESNIPGIECSQCVRIVKRDLLLKQYSRIHDGGVYYGEDVAITYPLYLDIKNMQVVNESYYMHRQRRKEIPIYIKNDNYLDEVHRLYRYLIDSFSEDNEKWKFRKQIEYFYIYSVNLCKMKYNDYFYIRNFLFPFDKVEKGHTIVLYGAGAVGNSYYSQLEKLNYCNNIYWVDKNAESIADTRVKNVDIIKKIKFDYIVISIENKNICNSVKEVLLSYGIENKKIIF